LTDSESEHIAEWELRLEAKIVQDPLLSDTEKERHVKARVGQGYFRSNVSKVESRCRITGISDQQHLRASHIKPWRLCEAPDERLTGHNGLLLTPTIDHLFDKGFVTLDESGCLLRSDAASNDQYRRLGVPQHGYRTGPLSVQQNHFMEFHRNSVFV
jgi:predicted restriction endonuclease